MYKGFKNEISCVTVPIDKGVGNPYDMFKSLGIIVKKVTRGLFCDKIISPP